MNDTCVSRTLVKSPPELWSEISDLASLAEHLGEFGEIAITRLEPESTVAWEGESASGTVALEPTAWGTKVTLTATPLQAEDATPPEPEPEPTAEAEAEPEPPAEEPAPAAPVRRRGRFAFWRRREAAAGRTEQLPEPVPAAVGDAEPVADPQAAPIPEAEPEPTPFDRQAMAVLSGALDALGAARHRPFSRG